MQDELFDLRPVNLAVAVDTTGAVLALNKAMFDLTTFRWRSIGAAQRDVSRRVAWQKVMRIESLYLVGGD